MERENGSSEGQPLPARVTKLWSKSLNASYWFDANNNARWYKKLSQSNGMYYWFSDEFPENSKPVAEGSFHPWHSPSPKPVPPQSLPSPLNGQGAMHISALHNPTMQMGNSFLSSLENNHPWAFGAFAELVQNADDAGAKKLNISYESKNNVRPDYLLFEDDGKGMSSEGMKFCFTLGDSREGRESDDQISGQYGIGFKQGVLRIGHSALVISRSEEEESISFGILSNLPYKRNNEPPVCMFTSLDLHGNDRQQGSGAQPRWTRLDVMKSLENVLGVDGFWVMFELGKRQASNPGTSIFVFGVEERSKEYSPVQLLEIRDDVEVPDILLFNTTKGERKPYKRPSSQEKWKNKDIPLESSLREYIKVLFLKPRMEIYLLDTKNKVEPLDFRHPDEFPSQLVAIRKGEGSAQPIIGSLGIHTWHKERGLFGAFCYTANCLIKSYVYDFHWISPSDANMPGVLMVLDLSKGDLRVLPNKQEYEEKANYPEVLDIVSRKMWEYSREQQGDKINEERATEYIKDGWINCVLCSKWRMVEDRIQKEFGGDKHWQCNMDADIMAEAEEQGLSHDACQVDDDFSVFEEKGATQRMKKKAKGLKAGETLLDVLPATRPSGSKSDSRSQYELGLHPSMILKETSFNVNEDKVLGSGRFATVYSGTWRKGDEVAIKIFKDTVEEAEFKQSFLKEQVAAAHTNNRYPNVITYYGFCSERKAIIMELVKGARNLKQVILAHSPPSINTENATSSSLPVLSILDRLQIMLSIAQGMSRLQDSNIVHRDLKPENILCSPDLQDVKITDFGICSLANKDRTTSNALSCFHSVHYSAPEQETAAKLTPSVDVWSFGVMLLEMCTCGEGVSLWGDISREQITARKLEYRKEMASSPARATHHLAKMLPVANSLFRGEGNLNGLEQVRSLVIDTLHPLEASRPKFERCKDHLAAAIGALSFEQCHLTSIVYHTLEPGDVWSRKKHCLRRKATPSNASTRELEEHVMNGSKDDFTSRFLSCTLDLKWAVHYGQVQEFHPDRKNFKGVLFAIDVKKVPNEIKRIDLSNKLFASKHFGTEGKHSSVVNNAACAKEVVFDLGAGTETANPIPAEAIVGVYDLESAPSDKKAGLHQMAAMPKSYKITNYEKWLNQARKDRQHNLSSDTFWTELLQACQVTDAGKLREVREKMHKRHKEYWNDSTESGKKQKAGGLGAGQGPGKKAKR